RLFLLSALSSLLQRVRAQAGPIESVLRRAESVHETPVGAQLSYDLRRRRAIARLYLCRGCGRTVRQSGARSGVEGKMYNAGNGGRYTLNFLWNALQKMEGIRIPARYEAPRAGDVRHSQADISAAVAELGHAPRFSIEEGLRRTLEWYRREG